jgi:hypothetical protein
MFTSRPKATDSEYRTESFGTPSHTQSMFASPRLQSTEHMLQSSSIARPKAAESPLPNLRSDAKPGHGPAARFAIPMSATSPRHSKPGR